jgi:hypothetical protein
MAVSARHRRKLEVDGRRYLWWIAEDDNSPFCRLLAITVASEDRRLLVRYHLGQPDELRHITVIGPSFKGLASCGGPWRRFRSPPFCPADEVHPGDVVALIRWCEGKGDSPVEVDYRGNPESPAIRRLPKCSPTRGARYMSVPSERPSNDRTPDPTKPSTRKAAHSALPFRYQALTHLAKTGVIDRHLFDVAVLFSNAIIPFDRREN